MAEAKKIAVVFAGGGTGGHLFPAIAVANEMKKLRPDIRIVFAGTREKIEARVVPQKGYEFAPIWISGVHRRLTLTNLLFPVKVIVSLWQSMLLLLSVKPQVVIGTGGYVCGPVLFMASLMRIPTIVHESNSYPGVTTRMLASIVSDLLITFDVTRKYLKKNGSRAAVTGTPTRDELVRPRKEDGLRQFGLAADKKTVFVFGGSQGAESINIVIANQVDAFRAAGIQLLWQIGGSAPEMYEKLEGNGIVIKRFIDDMASAYAAVDLVVSRSGATTIAELTRLGKPALLVPYPRAAADHQTMNALALQDAGGAVVIADREFPEKGMASILSLLQNDEALKLMSRRSLSLGRPTAGKEIAQRALELAYGN
jgi:UDP-N-acetylglucosamine--N-acetylmuramyl-(pentapeptide) pyrophosphoryl-undecaprenol N-acetylglucosamine transferase